MSDSEEFVLKVDFDEPPEELLQWAKENLNEDPDTRCEVINTFRDMIYERGECIPHKLDDAFLLRFLRARKFDLEKTHRLITKYYDFKENNPDIFENIDLVNLKKIGADHIISVPPYREDNGRRLIIGRCGLWDPQKYTVEEMFQAAGAILEASSFEPKTQILGGIIIIDCAGFSMMHARYITPFLASKVQLMLTSFPTRIHAIHILNQSYITNIVHTFLKPLIHKRIDNILYLHGAEMESLHNHISPKYLPERYGGIHPDHNYEEWVNYYRKDPLIIKEVRALGYRDSELEAMEEED